MLKTFVSTIQKHLAERRRYMQTIAEIDALSARDLAELRADATEMRRQAWLDIYGKRAA